MSNSEVRLAGAVRPEESEDEDPAGRDSEAQAIQRHHVAVSAAQAVQLKNSV